MPCTSVSRGEWSGVNDVKSYLRTFSGGELWATDELARALFRFNIDWDKAFGCQSDHRSPSRSRGPYIFRYFDVFGLVYVLDYISFFHVPWGLLTMRW